MGGTDELTQSSGTALGQPSIERGGAQMGETELLLGRLTLLATEEALEWLGGRNWISEELEQDVRGWWFTKLGRRWQIVRRIAQRLDSLALPQVSLTEYELRSRMLRRVLPDAHCQVCYGTANRQCQACRGTGRSRDDLYPCAECAGWGTETCTCGTKLDVRLPSNACDGMIAAAWSRQSNRVSLVRLHFARERSSKLVVGRIKLDAAHMWRKIVWWLAQAGIVVLVLVALQSLLRWTLEAMRSGLEPAQVFRLMMVIALTGLVGWAGALVRAPVVRHWAGERTALGAEKSFWLAPVWEKLAAAMATRWGQKVAALVLVITLMFIITATLGRRQVIFVGGQLALWMCNHQIAIDRFGALVRPDSSVGTDRARAGQLEAQFRRVQAVVKDHIPLGQSDCSPDTAAAIHRDISSLVKHLDWLTPERRSALPGLVASTAEVEVDWHKWDLAHDLFVILLQEFPAHSTSQALSMRAEWRVAAIERVSFPFSVSSMALGRATQNWDGSWEADCQRHKAAANQKLIVVEAKLAHVGRTRKEVVADLFRVQDSEDNSYACLGFQVDETETLEFVDGTKAPVRLQYLSSTREFPGISVGPDSVWVTMVFEVPQEAGRLELIARGQEPVLLSDM